MKQLRHISLYLAGFALSLSAFAMDAPKYEAVREKHPPTVTAAFKGIEGLPALKVFETQGVVDHVSSPKPVRFALNDKDGQTLIITITKPDEDIIAGAKLRVLGHVTDNGKYESLAVTPFNDEAAKPAESVNTEKAPAEQPAETTQPAAEQPAQNTQPAEQPVENTPPAAPPTQVETPPATVNMPQLPPVTVETPSAPPVVQTPSAPPVETETPSPAPSTVEIPVAPSAETETPPAPPKQTEAPSAPSVKTETPPAPPAPRRSEGPIRRPVPSPSAQRPGISPRDLGISPRDLGISPRDLGISPRDHGNTAPARSSIINRLRSRF